MNNRFIYFLTIILLTESLFVGCRESLEIGVGQSFEEIDLVPVSLNLSVCGFINGMEGDTKGPRVEDSLDVCNIKNLWVLQFDGTSEDASLIYCKYYPDYSAIPGSIEVINSEGATNRLFFLANTYENLPFKSIKTLSQARNVHLNFFDENSIISEEIAGRTLYFPVMNGYVDVPVSSGAVTCSLERSVAKIDCNVKCEVAGMSVENITICSVPDHIPCLTMGLISTLDTYPAQEEFGVTDFSPTLWSVGIPKPGDTTVRQFTYYLPCNKRGSITNDNPRNKSLFAPKNSTYAKINVSFLDGSITRKAVYIFYLGNNLTDDFNLLPNCKYTYNFTIQHIGDPDNDNRVILDFVDYRDVELSNSYMLSPSVSSEMWKTVIIPIRRVFDFWSGYAGSSTNSMENPQTPGWQMEIIWSDVPLYVATDSVSVSSVQGCNFKWNKSNKKYLNGMGEQINVKKDYFDFSISSDIKNANILVGIRRFSDTYGTVLDQDYLWSWHIWVTDYNPKGCSTITPQLDSLGNEIKFVYEVPGGAVHRYLGNYWKDSTYYKGKFIMDRNLGSKYPNIYNGDHDELYYQYGRKDPFPGKYIYNASHTRIFQQATDTGVENNVEYTVERPYVFINGGDWTLGATDMNGVCYNVPSLVWQDTKQNNDKSIFDPCPPGWMVPESETWSSFTSKTCLSGNPIVRGLNYFPKGTADKSTGTIYYPHSNAMHATNGGGWDALWGYGGYWTNHGTSTSAAYYFLSNPSPKQQRDRTHGMTIRCIQK